MIAEIENLEKNYKKVQALKGLTFHVEKGEVFGLIGPDGAGKTSLIRILTTLLLADSGSARVLGLDVVKDYKKIRKNIGYMPGRFSLYEDLSVEENLQLFAAIFGTTIEANYHLIKDIYHMLEPFKQRRAGKLSGGMKQKLALSCAMIHAPELIFLDEPTTGVDPVSRKEFWQMLKKLKDQGITIVVSTPYMDEASLCDRVALMQNGSILSIDQPQHIVDNFDHALYAISSREKHRLIQDLRAYEHVNSAFLFGNFIHYTDQQEHADLSSLKAYLVTKKHENIEIDRIKPNIEDCFMHLMGYENKTLEHE